MKKLITISLVSMLFFGCSEEPKEKDELLNKIEELQKSNDVLQKKNDSLSTLHVDIPDVEIREPKPDPKPSKRTEEIEEEEEEDKEELIDNQPDENTANPFGGDNGGSEFTSGGVGEPAPGNGVGDGGGGDGFGNPRRENNPKPPDFNTDFSGNVCVELLINAQGKAISAKSCNSTSHPDQNVIKSVVEFVKKNIKYKAEEGAPNRKAFYTVYIQAGY